MRIKYIQTWVVATTLALATASCGGDKDSESHQEKDIVANPAELDQRLIERSENRMVDLTESSNMQSSGHEADAAYELLFPRMSGDWPRNGASELPERVAYGKDWSEEYAAARKEVEASTRQAKEMRARTAEFNRLLQSESSAGTNSMGFGEVETQVLAKNYMAVSEVSASIVEARAATREAVAVAQIGSQEGNAAAKAYEASLTAKTAASAARVAANQAEAIAREAQAEGDPVSHLLYSIVEATLAAASDAEAAAHEAEMAARGVERSVLSTSEDLP